ncbi:MAG TPA: arabinofuranosidase catalytic domain-containing protein [Acidimicrobiales bacterium]|nr:arabinofuranosidase catalytic domain-containing protein [Acidimicrobiales bacterium]
MQRSYLSALARRCRTAFLAVAVCAATLIGGLTTTMLSGPNAYAAVRPTGAVAASSQSLPCDIFSQDGTPCVAAYSTTRALYASYNGPLYQVQRGSDGATTNIGLLAAGGYVNAGAQDSFCANTTCIITEIYDQSPEGNNLTIEGPGGAGGQDQGAVADALPITVGGHEAYGLAIQPGTGYRNDSTRGVAVNGEPEGMYMVASGTNVNSACCFDFGNAEVNNHDNGAAHMDAVNLSTTCYFAPCSGSGPWVEADLENGLFMGSGPNTNNLGNASSYVTAMLQNNGQNTFEIQGANSQSGGLTTWYNGPLPPGYAPMQQEGAIVLGTGGDDSNGDVGSWFEGVMTAGYPTQAADSAVQANIVSAGYSGSTNPNPSALYPNAPSAAGPAVVHSAGATTAYSSVFTVDSGNGDLQETYLPYIGASWTTQNLSTGYGTPPVMPGTRPVAIVHCGYTSVYTVDAGSGDLQETYLPAIGQPWSTQNLSTEFGTPPTAVTPTAVVHTAGTTGCGYTSVYTVDSSNGHLQETYLPYIGDGWSTQDLSANYGTPAVLARTSPVAIVHCGYTSVYTIDSAGGDLQETYLPAIGQPWSTQDLSAEFGTPPSSVTPTGVVHTSGATGSAAACGFTSVYTVDRSSQHLQETYLPYIGAPWSTQDLSAGYGTPQVAPGTQPVALYHTNYTSVYTVDAGSDHLQETYLPYIGDPWATQDLSANYGTPATAASPMVLEHPASDGELTWTSVYTVDQSNAHLQETYLPAIGDPWTTQDLSANYGTPPVAG